MPARDVVRFPNQKLKEKSLPIEDLEQAGELLDDLTDTLLALEGMGMSAPQIGEHFRVFVVNTEIKDPDSVCMEFINPEIIERSEKMCMYPEGCFSVPTIQAEIERHEKIKVKALNRAGVEVEYEAEGLLAVAIQHEIDHLNGILFWDRVPSSVLKSLLKRQYSKRLKVAMRGKVQHKGRRRTKGRR